MRWILEFLQSIFEAIFGCRHSNLSRPFTIYGHTYKVCMECSTQVFYSRETMKPLSRRELRHLHAAEAAAAVAVMPASDAARRAARRRTAAA